MSTRPRQSEEYVMIDGRHVAAATRRNYGPIEEADTRRENKLLPAERLARFEADVQALAVATGGRITDGAVQVKATTTEAERRLVLYQTVRDMRDEVKLAHQNDPALRRAFGVGLRLEPKSTPKLLTAGHAILNAWEKPELRQAAEAAGIDQSRMTQLAAHVAALAQADTTQNETQTKKRGKTMAKGALVRRVRKETSYVRRVAAVVFREEPQVLAEFVSTVPRYTVEPRSARRPKAKAKATRRAATPVDAATPRPAVPPTDASLTR